MRAGLNPYISKSTKFVADKFVEVIPISTDQQELTIYAKVTFING